MLEKNEILKNDRLQWILIFVIITIIGFFIRFYLFQDRNSWHDEWHSIYVSDPNISNIETFKRFWGEKGSEKLTEYYPPLYLFLLKFFFKLFGYFDDVGRLFSVIFGTLSITLSMYLVTYFEKSKRIVIFVGLLVSFNLFLIWQSLEIRAHSLVVFSVLLNLCLFFEVLKSKKKILLFFYYIVSLFSLSLWPISGLVFLGKIIYLAKDMYVQKKIYYRLFFTFFFILMSYIILNFDYLKFNLARDFHYTQMSETFFYNYHFRTFFGTISNGGFFLLIFGLLFVKNLKKILLLNSKKNLFIYIIISTYLVTIVYSMFRASIMSPKYVIFLVPLFLIWIVLEISKFRFSRSILVFISMISFFNLFFINEYPMKRPNVKLALNLISSQNKENLLYSADQSVFKNYLKTKTIFKINKFQLIELKNLKINQEFWFICLNNPRFAYGINNLEIQKKCKIFKENKKYEQRDLIKLTDLLLIRYKKIN